MSAAVLVALGVLLAGLVLGRPGGSRRVGASGTAGARPVPRWRARPATAPPGPGGPLVLDLVAAAVAGGTPPAAALAAVGAAVGGADGAQLGRVADRLRLGALPDRAWEGTGPLCVPLRRALELSEASGAPVAALLRDAADEQRRGHQREAAVAASRLGVRVVLPLGLCALPGFALLGVAPVVLGLAGQLLRG